jgi:putative Mg2+ transporter-C (MgtC) family protein
MENEYGMMLLHLCLAVLAGGLIGLERTYHGRPAGFRTHTLVCTASSVLMQLTLYQWQLLPNVPLETLNVDPTRMAQGIMTGIGFLGAGVIMKEGLTVRGLTTAASIWITAAIGILIGIGFYFPAAVATLLTFGTLSLFRWIETIMPSLYYARVELRFRREDPLAETDLNALMAQHGFTVANISYQVGNDGQFFEYQMTARTRDKNNYPLLAAALTGMPRVTEFRIHPTGD